ncbi:MAG: response regulator [Calditrichaeota bacterium]|nr:response regulator [Calditrichota bacterium]
MENGTKKILIIEDSLTMQRILSFVLEREGYDVEIAGNGVEGLEKARAIKPDLIFTDLMMPVMDGFEVCRQIRADDSLKDTIVIILTGRGQDSDVEKGLQMGADDYLMKPFDPPKVVERVRQIFGREIVSA